MILESSVKIRSAATPGLSSGGIGRRRWKSSASGAEGCDAGVATGAGDAVQVNVTTSGINYAADIDSISIRTISFTNTQEIAPVGTNRRIDREITTVWIITISIQSEIASLSCDDIININIIISIQS